MKGCPFPCSTPATVLRLTGPVAGRSVGGPGDSSGPVTVSTGREMLRSSRAARRFCLPSSLASSSLLRIS